MPMNSNGASWNMDFVTTTGNVIIDLLHNFHLECGARLHKLRVYETLTDPTGREVCGYLLVRGGVHAHAYALALEKITGVDIKKMLPTPNINLDKIPESQKYLDEGSHRRLYRFSADDYKEMAGIWQGEKALPGDPPGTLEVVDGPANWRKDFGTRRNAVGIRPGLRAGRDVRDRDQALQEVTLKPTTRNFRELRVVTKAGREAGWGDNGKGVNVKAPRFREQDILVAITTLIQVLVVQLLDSNVLTGEQAEQVFDGAAKRSGKDAAPNAQRLIQHLMTSSTGIGTTNWRPTARKGPMSSDDTLEQLWAVVFDACHL